MKRRKGFRLLTMPDGVWQWKAGKSNVCMYSPVDKKQVASISAVTGLSCDNVERAAWKGYLQITPKHIQAYIDNL